MIVTGKSVFFMIIVLNTQQFIFVKVHCQVLNICRDEGSFFAV